MAAWNILLIDDSKENCALISAILGQKAECVLAHDFNEGLEAYEKSVNEKRPYDCILLDVSMPGGSGVDALKIIRDRETEKKIPDEQKIPIIMVTAYKDPFIDAFNHGCTDYVLKPFDSEQLIRKISQKIPEARS